MLCINIDVSAPLIDFVNDFVPKTEERNQTVENFPTEINELVHSSVEDYMTKINLRKEYPQRKKTR